MCLQDVWTPVSVRSELASSHFRSLQSPSSLGEAWLSLLDFKLSSCSCKSICQGPCWQPAALRTAPSVRRPWHSSTSTWRS